MQRRNRLLGDIQFLFVSSSYDCPLWYTFINTIGTVHELIRTLHSYKCSITYAKHSHSGKSLILLWLVHMLYFVIVAHVSTSFQVGGCPCWLTKSPRAHEGFLVQLWSIYSVWNHEYSRFPFIFNHNFVGLLDHPFLVSSYLCIFILPRITYEG